MVALPAVHIVEEKNEPLLILFHDFPELGIAPHFVDLVEFQSSHIVQQQGLDEYLYGKGLLALIPHGYVFHFPDPGDVDPGTVGGRDFNRDTVWHQVELGPIALVAAGCWGTRQRKGQQSVGR